MRRNINPMPHGGYPAGGRQNPCRAYRRLCSSGRSFYRCGTLAPRCIGSTCRRQYSTPNCPEGSGELLMVTVPSSKNGQQGGGCSNVGALYFPLTLQTKKLGDVSPAKYPCRSGMKACSSVEAGAYLLPRSWEECSREEGADQTPWKEKPRSHPIGREGREAR